MLLLLMFDFVMSDFSFRLCVKFLCVKYFFYVAGICSLL